MSKQKINRNKTAYILKPVVEAKAYETESIVEADAVQEEENIVEAEVLKSKKKKL